MLIACSSRSCVRFETGQSFSYGQTDATTPTIVRLLGQQYWELLNTFEPGISPKLSSDIVDVMKIETRENNKRVLAPKAFLTLLYSIRYFPIYLNFEPEIG